MLIVRLAKVALVAAVGVFAFIVAYDNIVDYDPTTRSCATCSVWTRRSRTTH